MDAAAERVLPGDEVEDAPVAVRTQILATEHWSLLATRSMLWNEIFTRAAMFFTVVSASVVRLADGPGHPLWR